MTRRVLLAAAIAVGTLSAAIAVSGGFVLSAGGVRMSARSWPLSAALAVAAALVWAWSAARAGAIGKDLDTLTAVLDRRGRQFALAFAAAAFATAITFATYSASGADASGYLSQAAMWSRLETRVPDTLVGLPDWPLQPGDTAPLGWRPALDRGWQVPTYAPGLPWLMAIPHGLFGISGAAWVVAALAASAACLAGLLSSQFGGGLAAILAAALVATSPNVLYQSFQPMSDLPATTAWLACWWFVIADRSRLAGLAAAVAVCIRPNLAPLALVPWLTALALRRSPSWPKRAADFAVPVLVAGFLIALLQWRWYGSPVRSGYGGAAELFAAGNLIPNLKLYGQWLEQSEPVYMVLVVAAIASLAFAPRVPRPERDGDPPLVTGLVVFSAGVVFAYLVYATFEIWSYLRFLLPALTILIALASAAVVGGLRRLPQSAQGAIVIVLAITGAAFNISTARDLSVFGAAPMAARAREAGERLLQVLPPKAVLLAGEQSGSMRYTTGRPIVRWERLDVRTLELALEVLRRSGYEPWWVLDQFEEGLVRARFAGVADAALDRPPDIDAGPLMRTRAWRIVPDAPAADR